VQAQNSCAASAAVGGKKITFPQQAFPLEQAELKLTGRYEREKKEKKKKRLEDLHEIQNMAVLNLFSSPMSSP